MKILQLCFFQNRWPSEHFVKSIDIKTGRSVFDLPYGYGKKFDLVISAPPCDQFTKANALSWDKSPDYFIKVAQVCFNISIESGKPWLMENPPGRIETFLPGLKQFRLLTWHGNVTNKEYVVYGNMLLLAPYSFRYGKPGSVNNYTKTRRELWQPDFYQFIIDSFTRSL